MSPAMLAALSASILKPAILVQLTFRTGTVYVWSGVGNLSWNNNVYLGVGTLGEISVIEEGATVEAKGLSLRLSGINPNMLADALQEIQIGQPITIYLVLFDTSGAIIPDPLIAWSGRMDQPEFTISGNEAVIQLKAENRIIDLGVAIDRRYTLEDSQLIAPGDLGFSFTAGLVENTIFWGKTPTSNANL